MRIGFSTGFAVGGPAVLRHYQMCGLLYHWRITSSANSTVTSLNNAGVVAVATGAPHSLQNFEFGGCSVPHDPHTTAAAVMSRRHPAVVHVDIVSPLASQRLVQFSLSVG